MDDHPPAPKPRVRNTSGLRPNPQNLKHAPLREGEATTRVRVRGARTAIEAFEALTTEERGQVVERGLTTEST